VRNELELLNVLILGLMIFVLCFNGART